MGIIPKRPSLMKCFKQQPDITCPEDWFNACNEIMGACIVMGWIIMFIFDWEFINDNAMLNRLGYNPPGVAMVSTPSKYVCAVMFSVAMYCHLRYCYLDNMRCKISDATPEVKKLVWQGNTMEAFGWLCFPLVFVLTPDKNALVSFCAFSCLIMSNLMGMATNFWESDNHCHKTGSWVYFGFLAFFAIVFPVCEIFQLASYNEETKELGPVPVGLLAFLEYGWFLCLALQTRFMPAAPSVLFESKLVEDKDFQNEELRRNSSFSEQQSMEKDKAQPLGLLRLWRSPWDIQSPEVWFSASSECMVVAFIVSWTITAIFNRDLITNNALMERLGYNNICVAWDAPPALYPASIIYSFALYCQLRFCYLDNLRCVLSDATPSQKFWTRTANAVQGSSWCVFPLVFVITPDQNALIHSSAFVCMIFGNLFGMWMNFHEMDTKYHKKHSWKYLAFLTLTSIGFPLIVVLQLLTYNEETGELGPAPVWLNVVFDYSWFLALAVQTRFMPAAPSIFFKCTLQEDEDFKFTTKAQVVPCDDSVPPDATPNPMPVEFGASEANVMVAPDSKSDRSPSSLV